MNKIPLSITAALSLLSAGWSVADVPVIPRPVKETTPNGAELTDYAKLVKNVFVTAASQVDAPESLHNERKILEGVLSHQPKTVKGSSPAAIKLALDAQLPKEGYKMSITPSGISITGGDAAGVFYGIQSLNQMLIVGRSQGNALLPSLTLEDAPSCTWRGAMMDSARHFMPKEFVKKFIDLLALHKLNRMHWHIVDSEGWRLEIKKYPKLVEVTKEFPAAYPSEDPTDKSRPAKFMYGHFHGGGYYTQEDIKEIVAYAKARHVEIMPEIEFPGHAMTALTAYPEFGTTGQVPTVKSNISIDLFAPNEKALGFLKDILDETMMLFPFEVIHFGGDEAPKGQWKNSPEAQAKIKELGLKDENELQAWMFNELAKHVKKQGRRPAGWEEIMHDHNMDTLTKDAVIMPWLSMNNAVKSANNGMGIIHSQVGTFYLDSYQTKSPAENWTLYGGPLTLERLYTFNLYPSELTEEGRKNVYGAQCQLWSELMTKPEHVEYQAFPRLTALAELTWTPQERKNYQDYYKRLVKHASVLDAYQVNYRYINPLPLAKWNREMLDKPVFSLPLSQELIKTAKGELVVQFDFTNGSNRLDIKKVELLKDGKVIATDEHDGLAGHETTNNYYRLKAKTLPSGKYSLRITHANDRNSLNSEGDITVFTGKGINLFDPRNFAGGDHPSATWNKDETKTRDSSLRIPMDGLVRAPGSYELIFKTKDPAAPLMVGDVKVQGTGGMGSESKAAVKLDDQASTGILPFIVQPSDIKSGNSLVFRIKSDKPSQGEVRVRMTRDMKAAQAGQYDWNPELLGNGSVIAYIKDIHPKTSGKISLKFNYRSGSNALDIANVQILKNGSIIAESSQKGFAGSNPKDNTYTLESPQLKTDGTYNIRLMISGSGGADSNGVVTVE